MKYFYVENDSKYMYPMCQKWYGILDPKHLEKKKFYELPKHLFFFVDENMQMEFTDFILSPCFMVTERVRRVIALYDTSVKYKRVILFDKREKMSKAYYIVFLQEIDCIIESDRLERNKIGEIKIEERKITNRTIFKLCYRNKIFIIVRLDLIESILRRNAVGIGLSEAKITLCQKE